MLGPAVFHVKLSVAGVERAQSSEAAAGRQTRANQETGENTDLGSRRILLPTALQTRALTRDQGCRTTYPAMGTPSINAAISGASHFLWTERGEAPQVEIVRQTFARRRT